MLLFTTSNLIKDIHKEVFNEHPVKNIKVRSYRIDYILDSDYIPIILHRFYTQPQFDIKIKKGKRLTFYMMQYFKIIKGSGSIESVVWRHTNYKYYAPFLI
jgi:hypothetical protein